MLFCGTVGTNILRVLTQGLLIWLLGNFDIIAGYGILGAMILLFQNCSLNSLTFIFQLIQKISSISQQSQSQVSFLKIIFYLDIKLQIQTSSIYYDKFIMNLLQESSIESSVYICNFECFIREAKVSMKFPCSYFVEWSTPNAKSIATTGRHTPKQNQTIFDQKINLTTEMLYEHHKMEFLKKQTLIQLFLVSKSRPDQNKLVGRVSIDLAKVINVGMYEEPTQFRLNFCSVQGSITLQLRSIEQKLTTLSIHDLDRSSFMDYMSQNAFKSQSKSPFNARHSEGLSFERSAQQRNASSEIRSSSPKAGNNFGVPSTRNNERPNPQRFQNLTFRLQQQSHIKKQEVPQDNYLFNKNFNQIIPKIESNNRLNTIEIANPIDKFENQNNFKLLKSSSKDHKEVHWKLQEKQELISKVDNIKQRDQNRRPLGINNISDENFIMNRIRSKSIDILTDEERITALEQRIKCLNDQILTKNSSILNFQETIKGLESENISQKEQNNRIKVHLKEREKEISLMQQQFIKDRDQKLAKLNEYQGIIQSKTATIKQMQKVIAQKQSTVTNFQEQIKRLTDQLSRIDNNFEMKQLRDSVKIKQLANEELSRKLQQVNDLLQDRNYKLQTLNRKLLESESKIMISDKKIIIMEQSIHKLSQQQSKYDQINHKYQENLLKFKNRIEELQKINLQLNITSNLSKQDVLQTNSQELINRLHQEIDDLRNKCILNQQELETIKFERNEVQNELKYTQQKYLQLETICDDQKVAIQQLQAGLTNQQLNTSEVLETFALQIPQENFPQQEGEEGVKIFIHEEEQKGEDNIWAIQSQRLKDEIQYLKDKLQMIESQNSASISALNAQIQACKEQRQTVIDEYRENLQKQSEQLQLIKSSNVLLNAQKQNLLKQIKLTKDQLIENQIIFKDRLNECEKRNENQLKQNQLKLSHKFAQKQAVFKVKLEQNQRIIKQLEQSNEIQTKKIKLLENNIKTHEKDTILLKQQISKIQESRIRRQASQPTQTANLEQKCLEYKMVINKLNINLEDQINQNNQLSEAILRYMEKEAKMKETLAILEQESKEIYVLVQQKEQNEETYQKVIASLQTELQQKGKSYDENTVNQIIEEHIAHNNQMHQNQIQAYKQIINEKDINHKSQLENVKKTILQKDESHKSQLQIIKQKLKEENSQLSSSNVNLLQINKQLNDQIASLNIQHYEIKSKLELKLIQLAQQIKKYEAKSEHVQTKHKDIERAVKSKEIELDIQKTRNIDKEKRMQALHEEIASLRIQLQLIEEIKFGLQSSCNEKDIKIMELEQQISELNFHILQHQKTETTLINNPKFDSNWVQSFSEMKKYLLSKSFSTDWQSLIQNVLDKSYGEQATKLLSLEEKSRLLSKELQKIKSQLLKSEWRNQQQKLIFMGLFKKCELIVTELINAAESLNLNQSSFL